MIQKLKNKRILVLVPDIKPLNLQIVNALKDLGADVEYITDILFPYNPISRVGSMHKLRKLIYKLNNFNFIYHSKSKFKWGGKWDYFICFNGFSIHEDFMKMLRNRNPNIKCFYYLWDSLKLFRFEKNFNFFDKVYSFDLQDAKKYSIEYLPLFWVPTQQLKSDETQIQYEISFIGKLHSDRYKLVKQIEQQCIENNISYYFKIIITDKGSHLLELLRHIKFKLHHIFSDERDYRYEIIRGLIKDSLLSYDYIPYSEVERVIQNSKVILDIQLPDQSGYTNRMIQSLSEGKIILTTNESNENDIYFSNIDSIIHIDRNDPILDLRLFNTQIKAETSTRLQNSLPVLKIDSWLLSIVGLKH